MSSQFRFISKTSIATGLVVIVLLIHLNALIFLLTCILNVILFGCVACNIQEPVWSRVQIRVNNVLLLALNLQIRF